MRRTFLALPLALLPLAAAAQAPPVPADPGTELARINATLKEIVTLLKGQADLQGLDLLMKRVQLSESQLAEHERRLRGSESELRSLESERGNLEMRLKMFTSQVEKAPKEDFPQLELVSAQAEEELKRVRQRIAHLRPEIVALEGDVQSRRDDLRSWQSVLDRRLAKLGP
jgi:predicted  nucleic acid-binding Zn-ribbon protein